MPTKGSIVYLFFEFDDKQEQFLRPHLFLQEGLFVVIYLSTHLLQVIFLRVIYFDAIVLSAREFWQIQEPLILVVIVIHRDDH